MSNLKKIEEELKNAPSVRHAMQLSFVQERFIANYQSTTKKKDGEARFQSELFAFMEIINEKPDLARADRFSLFAALIKAGTTGLSFRDNKLYVMPGPNNTVKVQSSPAGKREMMENMPEIKAFPEAQLVMKGDIFTVDKLSGQVIKHESTDKSSVDTSKLDDIIASYQQVYWKNGVTKSVILYKADLLKAKSKSKSQSDAGFWAQWPGEACKKVATNRAFRLYHKYPDGIITFGKDEDKTDDTTFEELPSQPAPEPEQREPEQAPFVEAEAVTEPVRKQPKPKMKSSMDELLEE